MTLKCGHAIVFDVLDFEASSLRPTSYPIELGWTVGKEVHSYLIRPYAVWDDWDDYAEQHIHHITREQLMDEGHDPATVMTLANDSIGDSAIFCDGGTYDLHWLTVLARDSGVDPTFKLGYIQRLLQDSYEIDPSRFYQEKIKVVDPVQLHRAGYDAMAIKRALYACLGLNFG